MNDELSVKLSDSDVGNNPSLYDNRTGCHGARSVFVGLINWVVWS